VTTDDVEDAGSWPGKTRQFDERSAAFIDAETFIRTSYLQHSGAFEILASGKSTVCDPIIAKVPQLITELVRSVPSKDGGGDRNAIPSQRDEDSIIYYQRVADALVEVLDCVSLQVAEIFFDIAVSELAKHVSDDPEMLPCFVIAILAINKVLQRKRSEAAAARIRQLLTRTYRAQLDERRRIARELHDRLGAALSAALRHLELDQIHAARIASASPPAATFARDAVVDAMDEVRWLTRDLRHDPLMNLEGAVTNYLARLATDIDVRFQFIGDEKWLSPAVIDEAFLIIREAIRNAFTHAAARQIRIEIRIDSSQLHAHVVDDGCGFLPARVSSGSAGLASMQERAFLIEGMLNVSSAPGQGTRVDLDVRLPGVVG